MAFWNHSGPGSAVTQATSKATAVNTTGPCGVITMNNAALASATVVSFTVNNSHVKVNDTVALALVSGNATAGTYSILAEAIANGSFVISVKNTSAGSLSEALVISFAVLSNGI